MDALGSYHSLEQKLTDTRISIMGPTPLSRKDFVLAPFLEKGYIKEDAIVLDSDTLEENFEDKMNNNSSESSYNWEKLNEAMFELEDSDDLPDDDTHNGDDEHTEQEAVDHLSKVKRVLAFTSERLLELFSQCKRGSLDGTFKSSKKLRKQ